MSDYNRESAMLTPKQRAYLRGESEIEENSSHERAVRSRIRNRVRNSILDFGLLNGTIEQRDLKGVFDDDYNLVQDNPNEVIHVFNQVSSTLAVIFGGVSLQSKFEEVTEPREDPQQEILDMFADFVEKGIESMYVQRGRQVNTVNVDIDVDLGENLSELAEQNLSTFSEEELKQMLESGTISIDEYTDAIKDIYDEDIEVVEMGPDSGQKTNNDS